MKLSELNKGEVAFIDANIFVYHFLGMSRECKSILERCEISDLSCITSCSILLEVLHRLMIAEAMEKGIVSRKNPVKELRKHPEAVQHLGKYSVDVASILEMGIEVISITPDIIRKSADIRILVNDSIIATIMKEREIPNLIRNDVDFDIIEWIQVYKPSDI